MPNYFFDAHMHAMNLTHPNFFSFVDSIATNVTEFITSGALSPGYLLTPLNRGQQGFITLMNMFSMFERSIGEIFCVMEDDLSGVFHHDEMRWKGKIPENLLYPENPYIREGKIHFRSMQYDSYALVPLVMDFSREPEHEESRAYYTNDQQNKIVAYIEDTVKGISWYRKIRPEGMLEFFPFLGINPQAHDFDEVMLLLETYVGPHKTHKEQESTIFRGVKLYPPLGTNPWPEDPKNLEKIDYIYQYCITHHLPIITHCDDQGFRGVSAKLAQSFTSPSSWIPVLEKYPDLKIDFAHYGRQYSIFSKASLRALLDTAWTNGPWFLEIIDLMKRFDSVYADFSFSGTEPSFYDELHQFIYSLDDGELAQKILQRSFFGSDFSVNLAKVESYTNYLRIFEESPFSDEEVHQFVSVNPQVFLGLDTVG